MAHVLEIAQRRSNLVKGVLLLLCLFLNLLTILICKITFSLKGKPPSSESAAQYAKGRWLCLLFVTLPLLA